jgi:hypothetical protein
MRVGRSNLARPRREGKERGVDLRPSTSASTLSRIGSEGPRDDEGTRVGPRVFSTTGRDERTSEGGGARRGPQWTFLLDHTW